MTVISESVESFSSFKRLMTVCGETHIKENSLFRSILLESTFRILSARIMQDAIIPFGLRPMVIALYFMEIYIL